VQHQLALALEEAFSGGYGPLPHPLIDDRRMLRPIHAALAGAGSGPRCRYLARRVSRPSKCQQALIWKDVHIASSTALLC